MMIDGETGLTGMMMETVDRDVSSLGRARDQYRSSTTVQPSRVAWTAGAWWLSGRAQQRAGHITYCRQAQEGPDNSSDADNWLYRRLAQLALQTAGASLHHAPPPRAAHCAATLSLSLSETPLTHTCIRRSRCVGQLTGFAHQGRCQKPHRPRGYPARATGAAGATSTTSSRWPTAIVTAIAFGP